MGGWGGTGEALVGVYSYGPYSNGLQSRRCPPAKGWLESIVMAHIVMACNAGGAHRRNFGCLSVVLGDRVPFILALAIQCWPYSVGHEVLVIWCWPGSVGHVVLAV